MSWNNFINYVQPSKNIHDRSHMFYRYDIVHEFFWNNVPYRGADLQNTYFKLAFMRLDHPISKSSVLMTDSFLYKNNTVVDFRSYVKIENERIYSLTK